MEICEQCQVSKAHFTAPSGKTVCSNACAIDSEYKLERQEPREVEFSTTLYARSGIVIRVYDKNLMSPEQFDNIVKLVFEAYSQSYFCGNRVGNRYMPQKLLQPGLRFVVLAAGLYQPDPSDPYKKKQGVIGLLLCSESVPGQTTSLSIDLLCSPAGKILTGDNPYFSNRKNKKRQPKADTEEFRFKVGPVLMEKFVQYAFKRFANLERIDLTTAYTSLISLYAKHGFVLYPYREEYGGHVISSEDNVSYFIGMDKIVAWKKDPDDPNDTVNNWFDKRVAQFRQEYAQFFEKYRNNNSLDIGDYLNKESMDMAFNAKDGGHFMTLFREWYDPEDRQRFEINNITEEKWERLIIQVDEDIAENYYYTYKKIKDNYERLKMTLSKDQLDWFLDALFFRSDLRNKFNKEKLDFRFEKYEKEAAEF